MVKDISQIKLAFISDKWGMLLKENLSLFYSLLFREGERIWLINRNIIDIFQTNIVVEKNVLFDFCSFYILGYTESLACYQSPPAYGLRNPHF